jgi:hypothetical protein
VPPPQQGRAQGRQAPRHPVVKDNVLHGCQLFAQVFFEIGEEYPEIEKDTAIVDAFTQWLMGQPEYYDVVVTTNMFGDIVTDLASVLQGGMGMAVGANVGDDHGMFEPIHGSAPKHAGKDKVNPIAMILAVKEGLEWLGARKDDPRLGRGGQAIEAAVIDLLKTALRSPMTSSARRRPRSAPRSASGSLRRLFATSRAEDPQDEPGDRHATPGRCPQAQRAEDDGEHRQWDRVHAEERHERHEQTNDSENEGSDGHLTSLASDSMAPGTQMGDDPPSATYARPASGPPLK